MKQHAFNIFIDVDSVLLDYPRGFHKFMRERHPSIEYDYYDTYPFKFVNEFQESQHFAVLKALNGAARGLKKLLALPANIRIVTSSINSDRQGQLRIQNLENLFDARALANLVLLPTGASKTEWLLSNYSIKDNESRYILIDDHPKHITEWIRIGASGVLFYSGDWDYDKWPIPIDTAIAYNWEEIPMKIKQYIEL